MVADVTIKVISTRENAKEKHSRVAPNGAGFLLSIAPLYLYSHAYTWAWSWEKQGKLRSWEGVGRAFPPAWVSLALPFPQGVAPLKGRSEEVLRGRGKHSNLHFFLGID